MSEAREAREIIIVRRRGRGGDDGHHGGVWKIAFADFMTAMMAFFLVLWLVNSTNKAAKESIAQYFNPVRLVAPAAQPKGVETAAQAAPTPAPAPDPGTRPAEAQTGRAAAEQIFAAPAQKLDAIEAQAAPPAPAAGVTENPFAPAAATPAPAPTPQPERGPGAAKPESSTKTNEAQEIAQAIKAALPAASIAVDVSQTAEGILISIIDGGPQSMFASGTAEPGAALVQLMRIVGETVKAKPGAIVIRGHTDARPFRSGGYDNWRLSSDRAHLARLMLLRGGLEALRIERVEGHADRKPRLADKPDAAENRRIDILLRPAP